MAAPNAGLAYGHFSSPLGPLLVAGDADRLHHIAFPSGSRARAPGDDWRRDDAHFAAAFAQLAAYFAGELTRFELPLRLAGTAFQNMVWTALLEIPFGETTSYGALAACIGRPGASRAVGGANGANPLPIVVPCHRVIGADRALTGFGGGLHVKRFLLALEQKGRAEDSPQGALPL